MRSTYGRSLNARAWNGSGTSSTRTATLDSTPMPKANVPTPRKDTLELAGCSAGRIVSDGETLPRSANWVTPAACSASLSTAETASGTSWRLSSRLLAVTTTSSSAPALLSGVVAWTSSAARAGSDAVDNASATANAIEPLDG